MIGASRIAGVLVVAAACGDAPIEGVYRRTAHDETPPTWCTEGAFEAYGDRFVHVFRGPEDELVLHTCDTETCERGGYRIEPDGNGYSRGVASAGHIDVHPEDVPGNSLGYSHYKVSVEDDTLVFVLSLHDDEIFPEVGIEQAEMIAMERGTSMPCLGFYRFDATRIN